MRMFPLALAALLATGAATVSFTTTAVAHPGGHEKQEPLNADEATAAAKKILAGLITDKKLDASWKDATSAGTSQRTVDGKAEWLAKFSNAKAADAAKRDLYVSLTPDGRHIASNFTGK